MIKNITILIILLLNYNLYSQKIESNIQDVSSKICDCSEENRSELNDKLLADCFNKVYSKNIGVMNDLIKEISKDYPNSSELEKKGIIGNLINQNLGLNCKKIGDYISKKITNSNNSQLLNEISTEICNEINQKFKSSNLMSYENVDPIFGKYVGKRFSDIKNQYENKGKKIEEFGKDLVGVLMRDCKLYREWTIRITTKE